jgi:Lsr2
VARQQVITYMDDLTGKPMDAASSRTVRFVVDRQTYEVDVSGETFTKWVEPLIKAGRKVREGNVVALRPTASTSPTRPDKEQNRAMRAWWQASAGNGNVPPLVERGRIPADVMAMYHEARGIPLSAPEAAPIEAAKQPRKAGTVGSEMTVTRKPPARKATNPAKARKAAPTVAGKSPRRQGTRTA